MTAKTFSSWKGPSWESQWMKMVFISLGLHLFILALFLNIFPKGGTAKKMDPAYFVNLVSLPGSGPQPVGNNLKTKEPIAAPSPPRVVEPKPIPIPKSIPEKHLQVEDRSKTLDQTMEQLKQKGAEGKIPGKNYQSSGKQGKR